MSLGATAVAGDHEVHIPPPVKAAEQYELPLVGLRPKTEYRVRVDGVAKALTFRTGALPPDFPPIHLTVDRTRSQPGLTLLSLQPWGGTAGVAPEDLAHGYIAAVDDDGYVVWYLRSALGVLDAHTVPNGDVMFTYDELAMREVDVLGRLVRELDGHIALDVAPETLDGVPRTTANGVRVDADSVHHDAQLLPNGDVLFLSTEMHPLTGPSKCGESTAESTYNVIADVVVEADADTGKVVQKWPLLDVFDPFERPGNELCNLGPKIAPPNYFYLGTDSLRDWTHANSVFFDEADNALVVSSRHLSSIYAVRYHADSEGPAGELLWELGAQGTLKLDGEPTSYQHAAEVLPGNRILAYDNGNFHPDAPSSGGGAPPYSRAVIYQLDPDAGTARQTWQYITHNADGTPAFTAFLGDADLLENGNILITNGTLAGPGGLSARIVEVEPKSNDIVYDLTAGDAQHSWSVYRSERFPTLTP